MAYNFDQVFAADPANPSNIATNAAITIFAPGDATQTPLAITDPSGAALPNPLTVNANGFGSAFQHATLDRVAWAGGGFTGFFTSYEGMKAEAVAAREAAETAGADAAAAAAAGVAGVAADADAAAAAAAASATAAANSAALVGAPADAAIAAAINGSGATKTALNATILDKGSDVFGRQVDVRDSFTGKADGLLATGTVADTGHRYTIAKNTFSTGYKIVNGYLMHDQGTTTDTTADYAGIVLPSRVGRIWADFRYPTSAIPQSENLTLIVSDALFAKTTPGDSFANAATHFNITRTTWSYEILQKSPFTITQIANGTFGTPLAFDTDYQVAIEYSGTTATIYLPDGTVKTATHANIDTWRGKHATIEHYAFDGSARSLLAVKNWGADIEKTDLSRAVTMQRVQASAFPKATSYRPATQADYTATASLADVDATNLAITFTAPSTGKVIIRVQAWLDTNSTGDTLWGLSHNGTGGYGGGAKRIRATTFGKTVEEVEWVLDGFTPYQVVTAKLQHMVTGGGASIIRAHAGNGWYFTMSVTPAQ